MKVNSSGLRKCPECPRQSLAAYEDWNVFFFFFQAVARAICCLGAKRALKKNDVCAVCRQETVQTNALDLDITKIMQLVKSAIMSCVMTKTGEHLSIEHG